MSAVHNSKDSLFGGVNQQAAEFRQPTQVEEMVNAYPTIDRGLLKRNPTRQLALTSPIEFTDDIWTYEYNRGFSGDVDEKYAIHITNESGMEILNVNNGRVYSIGNGLSFEGNASDYLFPFIGANGYAATTIKDTTFIVNKNRTPTLDNRSGGSDDTPVPKTYKYTLTELKKTPSRAWTLRSSLFFELEQLINKYPQSKVAPSQGVIFAKTVGTGADQENEYTVRFGGSTTSVIVDGTVIIIDVPVSSDDGTVAPIESLTSFHSRLESSIRAALTPSLYSVERASNYGTSSPFPPIRITRWDEANVSVSFNTTINQFLPYDFGTGFLRAELFSIESDYFGATTSHDYVTTATPVSTVYEKDGFIWIKRSDPTGSGYKYTFSTLNSSGQSIGGTVTETTTDAAASAIATIINGSANFSSSSLGSVVKITTNSGTLVSVSVSDSFGSQASFGWAREVQSSNDLPKTLGFVGSLVKVIGTSINAFAAYWLVYTDGQWRETLDPDSKTTITSSSMPHVLTRNADDTFTMKPFDGWEDKKVGDDDTNPPVSFLSTEDNKSPVIKDIFFFKNRLGFITSRTVIMSEVGSYGNFWRTSVAALLDSDRIDAAVDTTKAIDLEYATYLEDSIMLFSDIQFRLQGGSILSPSNVQISQTSAYELNRNIRPIFMNDRIFFCVNRGNNTAVMEYFVSESASAKSEANDTTAHVQTYIPSDVIKLSGSAINNMLFLVTKSEPDTVFVYRYYDSGSTRIQAAWFKWVFNGTVLNAFSFGKNLNIMINRNEPIVQADWVLGSGIWDGSKLWTSNDVWVGSPSDLGVASQYEQMNIAPDNFDTTEFIDDNRLEEERTIVTGYSLTSVDVPNGQVLSREDFSIVIKEETTVEFNHTITNGSLLCSVFLDNNTSFSAVANVGDDVTTIIIPSQVRIRIIKLEVAPAYDVSNTSEVTNLSISQDGVDGNMIESNTSFGWYVDGVSIPVDKDVPSLGSWFKIFGQSQKGSVIQSRIDLGEWVLDRGGKKETRGHLLFKTAQVTSETGSSFSLIVEDVKRNTTRSIKSKYTVDRKPMIYGNANNIRLSIANDTSEGFRINTVSLEGNFNIRSKRT